MKSAVVTIIYLVLLSTFAHARVGLAEVSFTTAGGHIICHCDPYPDDETPVLIGQNSLKQLNKWYFYKNYIIGEGKDYYFIFSEKDNNLQLFKEKEEWRNAIGNQKLNPLYTRWLDLSDSPDDFFLFLFFASFIIIPIILLTIIVVSILTIKKKIKWTRKSLLITGSFMLLVALFIYLKFNLQSL